MNSGKKSNNRIYLSRNFSREAKPLLKKYRSLEAELKLLFDALLEHPTQGIALGRNTYKIKLAISSKGRGKSGGARIISQLDYDIICSNTENLGAIEINLLSIYDKQNKNTISDAEIKMLIKEVTAEKS